MNLQMKGLPMLNAIQTTHATDIETGSSKKRQLKKGLCSAAVIFLAIIALYSLILRLSGIYPFGDTLNLLWDEDVQYVDYFSFYRDVLLGKAHLSYSFSKSLGGSLVALFGYYLGCPLNLLVVFFDNEHLPLFIYLLTALKMGFSGVTMSVFMRKRFSDLDEPSVIGLSIGYGVSQYVILQCSNIMWMDGVILLPLLLLSIYRFVTEKKKGFLFIMVLFSIMINWYTGYMTCLFAAAYFIYERILKMENGSKEEIRHFFTDGIQCAVIMVLGVCGSAVAFYPVFKGLQKGKQALSLSIFYPDFYGSFLDIFRGFAEGSVIETVSLYCGTIFFAFFLYYFFSRQISMKERILSLIAVLFMFLSCWFVPLDCIWSGLRSVASFRFRYSFIVIFLVLYFAAKGILLFRKRENNRKFSLLFAGITIIFVLSHLYENYGSSSFKATLYTLIAYILIYLLAKKRQLRLILTGILLCVELTANGALTFLYNYQWTGDVTDYQDYASGADEQAALVSDYDSSVFYRMETVTKRYNESSMCSAYLNDSLAYGYHGIAHYSSTFDTNISNMIYQLGYSSILDLSIYTQPILTSDSLLGIKYVLSDHDLTGLEKVDELGTINGKNVYLNPYALGLGMGAADTVSDELEDTDDPFAYQNELFSNILGEEVELFKEIETDAVIENNTLSFTLPEMEAEDQLYGYVYSAVEDLVLSIDGEYRCNYACWLSYKVFDLGMGDTSHTVSLANYTGTADDMTPYFYYLDWDVFEEVIETLREDQFRTEVFEDGHVEGTYEADEAGNLLLTIPYDEGWTVEVNGQTVEYTEGAGALMVIPVQAGENQVVLQYKVPGVTAGIILSVLSILIMAAWCIRKKRADA